MFFVDEYWYFVCWGEFEEVCIVVFDVEGVEIFGEFEVFDVKCKLDL